MIMDTLHYNSKYTISQNFFEKIDTQEKAYILGFISADGCVHKTSLIINISNNDIEILEKIKENIGSTHPIKISAERKSILNGKIIKSGKMAALRIVNKKISIDLFNLGIVPKKSLTLKFPTNDQVPNNLIRHFIRGYFDGDGSVFKSKKCNCLRIRFCGTYDFLLSIKGFLENNLIKSNKITKNHNIFEFGIGGKKNINKFYNFLYKDSTIFLQRKKNIFKNYYKLIFHNEYGVCFLKKENIWLANFFRKYMGRFKSKEEALRVVNNEINNLINI